MNKNMEVNQSSVIDKEKMERFFFYGIENKRELKEGFLYLSYKQIYQKDRHKWIGVANEQIGKEIVQGIMKRYTQFYRFVTLNDESHQLTFEVDTENIRKELEEEWKQLIEEQKIIDTETGLYFTRERENLLEGGQYYVYGEGLKGEIGWTRQIYDILGQLEQLERENSQKYYQYWLLTKIKRTMNRGEKEEASRLTDIYKTLKQRDREEKIR